MTNIPITHPGHLILNQGRPTWLPDCYKPKYQSNSHITARFPGGFGYLWTRAEKHRTDVHICTGLQYNEEANYLHEYSDDVKNNKFHYNLYGAGINFKDIDIKESLTITMIEATESELINQLNKMTLRPAHRTIDKKNQLYNLITVPHHIVQLIGMNFWEYHIALYIDDPKLKMLDLATGDKYAPDTSNNDADVYMQFRLPLYKEPKETIITEDELINVINYDAQVRSDWRKLPWPLEDLYNMNSNPG